MTLPAIRTLLEGGATAGLSDRHLLARFVAGRDAAGEAAFAALVERHGPMVLGVCRRALSDPDDVADAFQATFLVLVRKAHAVRVDDSLGRWLFGVSRKVAARARTGAMNRARRVVALPGPDGLDRLPARPADPDRFEQADALDAEIARLPAAFRAAIVLCDLQGSSVEEAARRLVCPIGTVKSRLARGRRRLRDRLARRGFDPGPAPVAPPVPPGWVEATVALASGWVHSGRIAAAGLTPAAALAREVLAMMFGAQLKWAGAVVASVAIAATGATVVAQAQKPGARPSTPTLEQTPAWKSALRETNEAQARTTDLHERLDRLSDLEKRARWRLNAFNESGVERNDPSARRARMRAEALEASLVRIDEILAGALHDGPDSLASPPPTPEPLQEIDTPNAKPPTEAHKVSLPEYVVAPPDILVVEVLEALPGRPITGERLVRPDGTISLGFYGDLNVAGLTLREIKEKLILHLRSHINDEALGIAKTDPATQKFIATQPGRSSRVFVDVAAYNSKVYYVQGDVGSPGRLPVTGNDTVLDAIQYGQGLTPRADRENIYVIRPAIDGRKVEQKLMVDLDAIVKRGDTTTNYQLIPGDRVIVERSPKPLPPTPNEGEGLARLQAVEAKLDAVLKALEPKADKP